MSNRTTAWAAGLALVSVTAVAADCPVHFGEMKVSPNVVKQGEQIAVSIPFTCDAGWRYSAYRILAYRPYVPTACLKAKPWPLSESEHGHQWDSFQICKWTWLHSSKPQPTTLEVSFDTTNWPEGDYQLAALLLFRDDSTPKGQANRDRYLSRNIHLSVLPRGDRMGSRVEQMGFAWKRGKVVGR